MITSGTKLIVLAAALAAVALPTSAASASSQVAPSPHASAGRTVADLHFPLDGTDPIATGCATSAVTVANTPISIYGISLGDLQLRWSTACRTNWGKFTGTDGPVSVWVYRQADNKWCGDQSGTGCNAVWRQNSAYSNQLYGCNYKTLAEVEIDNDDHPLYFHTPFVGGC